jgi:hypothetical protein
MFFILCRIPSTPRQKQLYGFIGAIRQDFETNGHSGMKS